MRVDAGSRYTLSDVYTFPDDGKRREIIDGVLYVTPEARVRHQLIVGWLTYRFVGWTQQNGGYVFPGVNVDLDEGTHLEPDVAVVGPGRELGDLLALQDAPELVVEVSSSSTKSYDTGLKRARYAAAGVEEHWFVDLDEDVVSVSVLQKSGRYGEPVSYGSGHTITSHALRGLAIDVDELLDR